MQQSRALPLSPSLAVSSAAVVGVALLTALCAQISIPIGPVPQTLQTFAVLGGSAYLGGRRGLTSMALYVAMGLVLPVYAHGDHGWSVIASGTGSGGYLIGFIVAGYATGLMRERLGWSSIRGTIPAMLMGSVCVYVPGLIWLHHTYPTESWSWVIHWGLTVFIIGDLVKILGASAVLNPKAPWGGLFDRIRLF